MWQRIKRFFKDSETIAWARIQALLGMLAVALTSIDPYLLAPVLGEQTFVWFLLINGVVSEYLRRRRDTL